MANTPSLLQKSLAALLALSVAGSAALLNVPNARPKVTKDWKPALEATWKGIKARNVAPYATGLVHRPKSESPGDAVSEGQGYGMMAALYAGDKAGFDSIWDAAEKFMWTGSYYNWRVGTTGSVIGSGAATDAEEDIATMLIFADKLVQAGLWQNHTSPKGANYGTRAQAMLNSIWGQMVSQGKYLSPGAGWGGADFVNPGYFAPAWYRVFKRFDSDQSHDWSALIQQCYVTINSNPGAALGMVPDWMTPQGGFYGGSLGYNPYDNGHSMYKDGVRILWRVATDAVWFNSDTARAFVAKSMAFLNGKGGASAANFYSMTGNVVSAADTFTFNGTASKRPRFEHSHLTIGMWAAAAMGAGTAAERDSLSSEMSKYYTDGNTFFGRATDMGKEDTAHNEMYFDQFLAWWGTALMAGTFSDIVYDLNNPPPQATLASAGLQEPRLHVTASAGEARFSVEGLRGSARLQVLDLHGRTLTSLALQPGQSVAWNTGGQRPGVLVARVRSADWTQTVRFVP